MILVTLSMRNLKVTFLKTEILINFFKKFRYKINYK